jgi:hypothetical protein
MLSAGVARVMRAEALKPRCGAVDGTAAFGAKLIYERVSLKCRSVGRVNPCRLQRYGSLVRAIWLKAPTVNQGWLGAPHAVP